jgi:pyruvate formate lyase activating enzyme
MGGDPTPQIFHALETSKIIRKKRKDIRICFETNGSFNSSTAQQVGRVVSESGGILKFDLKAWDEKLNLALAQASNRNTLSNFSKLARDPEIKTHLVASTLLIPNYLDEKELRNLAKFIAGCDPAIPWSLLAYRPDFEFWDMGYTNKKFAELALQIAKEEGLEQVNLGNRHLLG